LQDVVRFHGLKTKPEVAEFMRKADVFVLPSEWENLPCVIIEAMTSGLPIVATSVGGIPEMVDDKMGLLVPPRDSEKLMQALHHMLDTVLNYPRESIAARARARYSYESVGEKLTELYWSLRENID